MNSVLPIFRPGPVTCLKCGHAFLPGTPEPSWCPGCGRLCSAFDEERAEPWEEEPLECQETPAHRRGWWMWLCLMLLVGPVGALLIGLASKQVVKRVPVWLKDIAEFTTGEVGMACAIFCGALGAIYCVARLRRGQHRDESLLVLALSGFVLFISYLVLCGLMVSTLLRMVR